MSRRLARCVVYFRRDNIVEKDTYEEPRFLRHLIACPTRPLADERMCSRPLQL